MPSPLNPTLFELLQTRFPVVRIVSEGQPRIVDYIPNPMRPGMLRAEPLQRGEQYAVDCPFCDDDRQRLFISYQFGQRDPATGRVNDYLAYCHNEHCHQSKANRASLRSMLTPPLGRRIRQLQPALAAVGMSATTDTLSLPQEMSLPGNLSPIDENPPCHPAIEYVFSRGFTPGKLWDIWQVYYCEYSPDSRPSIRDRIIIPVYRPAAMFTTPSAASTQPPVLAGWQARVTGPVPDYVPRYLSAAGMQKSKLLYGLPQALQTAGPVFVTEGVTDTWRIGPGAVSIFGSNLSSSQKLLLVHHFVGRPIVVALDTDARDKARSIVQELSLARTGGAGDNRVVLLELPAGRKDPGECTREEIRAATSAALGYACV